MNPLAGLERRFGWLLQTSWQAAVVAGLILLAQVLLRKRLSPAWRHGLWFLLLVRLLMPMTPSSGVSVFNLAKGSAPKVTATLASLAPLAPADVPLANTAPRPRESLVPPASAPQAGSETALQLSPAVPVAVARPMSVVLRPRKTLDWPAISASVWFAGTLVLALRFVWSNHRFGLRLAGYLPVRDDSFGRLLRQCAELLGVRQEVVVIETEEVESPAVYGLWQKRLLLPDGLREALTPGELRHVLLHELAHIKRRDPELNCLVAVLQILHWFNPVLWFAFARMRTDRELATDELALAHAPAGERCAYGETILKVLEGLSERPPLPGLVGIGESAAQIGERIRAIARGSVGRHWQWAASVLVVVIAGVALTSAREEQQKGVDLLIKYPTTLTSGDAVPARARPWQFTEADIFQVSRFTVEVGKLLRVETQVSDLGIGHCADGAIWAVLIPREEGKLTSSAATNEEKVAHVWLRFHPSKINRIFAAETVSAAGRRNLEERMRAIADAKFRSSWHAGNNAMIPEPKDLTVDVDTKGGPRRFFVVDTDAKTAEYVEAFAERRVPAADEQANESFVDTNCASVISVSPPNGAQNVELAQELRIGFDHPMNPYTVKLEWLAGGFQPNGSIQVGADRKEFIIPVRLTPGQEQTLALNHDP
jgi:beta-lactamase regulating signal transducer with metallopeptidase domain